MSTVDWDDAAQPGADLHQWESSWASIEEDADGDPGAALSLYADLLLRMLKGRGYSPDDPVVREGDEREVVATYLAVHDTAERAELGSASRGEVDVALDDANALFDSLASEARRAT